MGKLKLTQGKETLIDDNVLDLIKRNKILKNLSWHVRHDGNNWYVEASIKLHRLVMNAKPRELVDHKNGNTLDNRKENLRIVTYSQNNANRKAKKNGQSKYLGVSVAKYKSGLGFTKRYIASIKKDYKVYYLGSFEHEIDAAKAYNKKAIELHGEFANLNII